MAITVVQGAQSAGSSNNTLIAISAATIGNTLISFMCQTGLNVPTCTGFTVHATSAVYNTSLSSVWVAYKISTGGETSATWVAGSGGTAHGVAAWELAGAASSVLLDGSPVHTDNIASGTSGSLTVANTVIGSVILLGLGADAGSGTIGAWTGTNVATNISTVTSRCFGGSFITTSLVNSAFTANWATAHVSGMLALTIQPPQVSGTIPVHLPFM